MERPAGRVGNPWGAVAQDRRDVEPDPFEESEPVPAATVTLVEGASFAIGGSGGDIERGGVEGLFVGDTRICSRMVLSIDGLVVEPLSLAVRSPSSATFVGRTADRRLLVFRDPWVGQGMRLDLRIRNLDREPRPASIRIALEAERASTLTFADIPLASARVTVEVDGDAVAVRGLPRGLALIRPSG